VARRRYLIAYDISDPRRLRKVIKVMESYGDRLQYSVFLCDLTGAEMTRWRAEMLDEVHLDEDSVVMLDLGPLAAPVAVAFLGRPRALPRSGPAIV